MAIATQTLSRLAYLTRDRQSSIKSDLIDGQVYQMAGASLNHNRIVRTLIGEFYTHMYDGDCEVLPSDMRVRVDNSYMYPDIVILCDEPDLEDNDVLLNPTIIIEVLSPSTEAYDRGDKSQKFRTIESLQEYALISQDKAHIEHYIRQDNNTWIFSEVSSITGEIRFQTIDCALRLADIYRRVNLKATE